MTSADDSASVRSTEIHLSVYVLAGVLAGAAYVALDLFCESKIERGTLTGALAAAHAVIDEALPLVVGALLGVCAHYLRVRARLRAAEESAARAEALRARLHRVERDQAVWVVAAAVLHELNNPLHAIGLLLDEQAECADAERRADLGNRARTQADRALAKLRVLRSMRELRDPEPRRIPLERVVGEVAHDARELAKEDGLVVSMECERAVEANADPTYVRAILENLLDNSLQSVRAAGGGHVTIRLGASGDRALVRVSDDGPALDDAIRASLFEPLRSSKTNGLGLGLPLARALARAMRGEVSFDDSGEKAFCLELPLGSP